MKYSNFPLFVSNIATRQISGGVILYKDEPLMETKEFREYLITFFNSFGINAFGRTFVKENINSFVINKKMLEKALNKTDIPHSKDNQIYVIKDKEIVAYAKLDEVITKFKEMK
jgi:uncharacterized protein YjfI (DUF2170 family)